METLMQVDLSDVHRTMNLYLDRINYPHLDNDAKKIAIETGLRKYLIRKIRESHSYVPVDDSMNVNQLIGIVSFISGVNKDDNISALIHYILFIMSNEQQFIINWNITDDETTEPQVLTNSNIVVTYTTKTFPESTAVNILYNYFLHDFKVKRTR